LILNRSRRRAPNFRILDRLIAGFCSLWITPNRFRRVAIAFKPSTLLNFHRALVNRHRSHAGLRGETPIATPESRGASLKSYRWQRHCRGLYQTSDGCMSTNSPRTGYLTQTRTPSGFVHYGSSEGSAKPDKKSVPQ
jgi:hypothetical protein